MSDFDMAVLGTITTQDGATAAAIALTNGVQLELVHSALRRLRAAGHISRQVAIVDGQTVEVWHRRWPAGVPR